MCVLTYQLVNDLTKSLPVAKVVASPQCCKSFLHYQFEYLLERNYFEVPRLNISSSSSARSFALSCLVQTCSFFFSPPSTFLFIYLFYNAFKSAY